MPGKAELIFLGPLLWILQSVIAELPVPPKIIESQRLNILFSAGDDVTLNCIAEGSPTPRVFWIKNRIDLDYEAELVKDNITQEHNYPLMMKSATEDDAGYYQCKAENIHGISVSNKFILEMSFISTDQTPQVRHRRPPLGQYIRLNCRAPRAYPAPTIMWSYRYDYDYEEQEDYVQMSERVTMDDEGNLYFVSVQAEDVAGDGEFVCGAYQKSTVVLGNSFKLTPKGDVPMKMPLTLMYSTPNRVLALKGKRLQMMCIFGGNPVPQISWSRADGSSLDTTRVKFNKGNFQITIEDLKEADMGVYTCRAVTPLREMTRDFTVDVDAAPSWVTKPTDLTVSAGEDVDIVCRGAGNPSPEVEWLINGIPLGEQMSDPRRRVAEDVLHLQEVGKSDTMVVQCNVSNRHGYLWSDTYLSVLALPAQIGDEAQPENMQVRLVRGATGMLDCPILGHPTPILTWFKGVKKVPKNRNYQVEQNGSLVIQNVGRGDAGLYKCRVVNRFGEDTQAFTVLVRDPTQIVIMPQDTLVRSGYEAVFNCKAIADPEEDLQYTWMKDGIPLDATNPLIDLRDGRLVLKNAVLGDAANYTCVAGTVLDAISVTVRLEVQDRPSAPTGVQLTACTATSATVVWDFGVKDMNHLVLKHFIVEYNTTYQPVFWTKLKNVSPEKREATLSLSPFVEYSFRVRAVNDLGAGTPSRPTPTRCRTPGRTPDTNPQNVRTVEDITNSLVIEWEPMPQIEHNGPDFHYVVSVRKEDEQEIVETYTILDFLEGRLQIPVDNIYYPYLVSVKALNAFGEAVSAATVVRGFSGEGVPTVFPDNLTLSADSRLDLGEAEFSWNGVKDDIDVILVPIVFPDNFTLASNSQLQLGEAVFTWEGVPDDPAVILGKLRGYKIRYWKVDDPDNGYETLIPIETVRGSGTRALVRHLPMYANLQADVAAVNTYFTSIGSNIVNFSTPEGVPNPPEYVVVTAVGAIHFLIEWGKPDAVNGVLTGYRVGYKESSPGSDAANEMTYLESEKQKAFIGELKANTDYLIYVWARTKQGLGDPFYIEAKTAKKNTVIGMPEIVSMEATDRSAVVKWILLDSPDTRAAAYYYLEYKLLGSAKWRKVSKKETINFSQKINGLDPQSTYEVRVAAEDNRKQRSWSLTQMFDTDERDSDLYPEGEYMSGNGTIDDEDVGAEGSDVTRNVIFVTETPNTTTTAGNSQAADIESVKNEITGTMVKKEKTRIVYPPLSQRLDLGEQAFFKCGAITDPHLAEQLGYIWLRDGVPIERDDDPRVDMTGGTLQIMDVNSGDTAEYTCMAVSGQDNATATATLEVEAPPGPPYNLSLLMCHSEEAEISWVFDKELENFSPVQSFIVEYNTSFAPNKWTEGVRTLATSRSTKIALSRWVQYNFRVKAVNGIGTGKPSSIGPHTCKTPQGRPKRHPGKVKTVGDKSNFLIIEWEPMDQIDHAGSGFFYNITVMGEDNVTMSLTENNYTVGRMEIRVDKIYAPYNITVAAQNNIGQPYIKPKVIRGYSGQATPKVVPKNFELDPDKIVTATTAYFRWDPVDTSKEEMQGVFIGYTIRHWKEGQKNTTVRQVLLPMQSEAENGMEETDGKVMVSIDSLQPNSDIEAEVMATNTYFSSNSSNRIKFSTPEGVPSAVEYLEILFRGSNHFLLEWGEPVEPNGIIIGYKIGYAKTDEAAQSDLEMTDMMTRRRLFLGNLEPDTLYRVSVWAFTQQGQGKEYYTDMRTAEMASELAEPKIDLVIPSDTAVNVTWQVSDTEGVRIGSHYYLEYRPVEDKEWTRVKEEKNDNFWQQIEGLESGTTYQVRAVAADGVFGSNTYTETPSEKRTFTTTGEDASVPVTRDVIKVVLQNSEPLDLICQTERNHSVKVRWSKKQAGTVERSENTLLLKHRGVKDSRLIILRPNKSDEGMYICKLSGPQVRDTRHYQVSIKQETTQEPCPVKGSGTDTHSFTFSWILILLGVCLS